MAKYAKIPEATVRRLSNYLKCLEDLEQKGEKVASSALIALICNVNAAQVRKDFAYFGEFGIRGMGYSVTRAEISHQGDPRDEPGMEDRRGGDREPRKRHSHV